MINELAYHNSDLIITILSQISKSIALQMRYHKVRPLLILNSEEPADDEKAAKDLDYLL